MTKPHTFNDEDYQKLANAASRAVYSLLQGMHQTNNLRLLGDDEKLPDEGDAGPVISGAIGGLLAFYMDGDGDPWKLADLVKEQLDGLIPQRLMDRAEDEAGAVGEGRA